jgi:hypothetical protein
VQLCGVAASVYVRSRTRTWSRVWVCLRARMYMVFCARARALLRVQNCVSACVFVCTYARARAIMYAEVPHVAVMWRGSV